MGNLELPVTHISSSFEGGPIGGAVATRAILADLRAGMDGPLGGSGGGPAPFRKEGVGAAGGDGQRPPARSRFLQALDRVLVGMR